MVLSSNEVGSNDVEAKRLSSAVIGATMDTFCNTLLTILIVLLGSAVGADTIRKKEQASARERACGRAVQGQGFHADAGATPVVRSRARKDVGVSMGG